MTDFPALSTVSVAITGAAGQIGYSLLPMIARGAMFGSATKVRLQLLDLEIAMNALNGVRMELLDCDFPLLDSIVCTSNPREAFAGADVAIFCGAVPRKPGMERKDLLTINGGIFKQQGLLLKEVAPAHCRVLVVGNPANTNALLLMMSATAGGGLSPQNVTALTRLDHNRAVGLASAHLGVRHEEVCIWGNHSSTQVPDVFTLPSASAARVASEQAHFTGPFIAAVQQRGAEVMKLRGLSSAASAAKAICDHIHDWIVGTDKPVSMAVLSDGNPYGVPAGLIYSFPVTCKRGVWTIVPGLSPDATVASLMAASTEELVMERTLATSE